MKYTVIFIILMYIALLDVCSIIPAQIHYDEKTTT